MPQIATPQQIAEARTLVGPLTARTVILMCDSHEQLRLERDVLSAEVERLHAELDACRMVLGGLVGQ